MGCRYARNTSIEAVASYEDLLGDYRTLSSRLLGAQTLRHIYVLFVDSNVSVLHKYDPSRDKIDAAKSLDELTQLYETTRKETLVHKKATPRTPKESVHDCEWRLNEHDSFESLELIRQAIEEYELHQRQLAELHFSAIAGGVVLLVGAVVYYRVEKCAGTSICLLGLIELDLGHFALLQLLQFASRIRSSRRLQTLLLHSLARLARRRLVPRPPPSRCIQNRPM